MAIKHVEINDFLIFKSFKVNFSPGVNIFIGSNATGKTTLLRCLYSLKSALLGDKGNLLKQRKEVASPELDLTLSREWGSAEITIDVEETQREPLPFVYIPEKDILEHAKGLLTFIEQKQTGFSSIYKDILIAAQDVYTIEQTPLQIAIGQRIAGIIGGDIHWDKADGSFYTLKTDGSRIPFANEASGYKKLGLLGLLTASGQLKSGSVLFWDEPENSLNPELMPMLTDILLDLSQSGVQIFIATHSEILAGYFAANRQKGDRVIFYSLYRDYAKIKVNYSDRFDLLLPNSLASEPVKLYEKQIEKGFGGNE
jgi:predicted ATPase